MLALSWDPMADFVLDGKMPKILIDLQAELSW